MPIQAIVFVPPNAQQEVITVTEINDEDAEWFTQHNIKISMEQMMNGAKVLYADHGDPEDEVIHVSLPGQVISCRDMMATLRLKTEKKLNAKVNK